MQQIMEMLRIQNIKCKPENRKQSLREWFCGLFGISSESIEEIRLVRESIDARKKPQVILLRTIEVRCKEETKLIGQLKKKRYDWQKVSPFSYPYPTKLEKRENIVVVGCGPAGLFAAYFLALAGQKVTLLERGRDILQRTKDVEDFWSEGKLLPDSNVSFGEGGAGTFSDGKLNTLVKDKSGRNRAVLETFVTFGAPQAILYEAKPHVGTDILKQVIYTMRLRLEEMGVEVLFRTCVEQFLIKQESIVGVVTRKGQRIPCNRVVLAIGHSARDTFEALKTTGVSMEQKAFAVGFRVEHPQDMINRSQYGEIYADMLPAAPYKLATKTSYGRNVYSFCMCPGGYVVNASTEKNATAVNGMSYSGRDGENANSAIIVSVEPTDFPSDDVLAGVAFQRDLERRAYLAGKGKVPCDTLGHFRQTVLHPQEESKTSMSEELCPQIKGGFTVTDISGILPRELNLAFLEGMEQFGRQIEGFDREDAILSAVESRTSSPVRILRNEAYESNIKGLYPCGEGAGYAGGIMSAAMDGIKVAEAIISQISLTDTGI